MTTRESAVTLATVEAALRKWTPASEALVKKVMAELAGAVKSQPALDEDERFALAERFRLAFDEDPDERRVRDTWLLAADVATDWFSARAHQPTPPALGDCGHGHLTPEAQRACDDWTASVTTPPAQAEAIWECGPHANAWNGHDARCRRATAPPTRP